MSVSDFERNLVANLTFGPLRHIFIVVNSSLSIISSNINSESQNLQMWQTVSILFDLVVPRWNCDINLMFVDTTIINDVDDFGSELYRDI